MQGSGETGRFAETGGTEHVDSPGAVARIIEQMLADLTERPGEWENGTLERFLESLAAVVEGLPGRYGHRAEDGTMEPTWRMLAEALVMASGYE